jgi:hypothetical protein
MSSEKFDDDCKGCRPVLLDVKTGRAAPSDHPTMKLLNRVWEAATLEERQAFHRVCCLNSREPEDLRVMKTLADRVTEAAKAN